MASGNARPALTQDEYWRIFHVIRGDVEAAIKSNHTYLTIQNLLVSDRAIYDKINKSPEFWTLNTYALQTTFFIAFGRVFDSRNDSLSIQKLVKATIADPAFFSKAALRQRKRQASNIQGSDPDWLVEYVRAAWEPTEADLRPLKDALTPHWDKFRTIYRPIRHKAFAHRSTEDEAAIASLFSRTMIGDVSEILRFLHTVLWAIKEMAWNARRPDLTDFRDYEDYVRNINAKTEEFVRRLP
jgi:hypothetical protein